MRLFDRRKSKSEPAPAGPVARVRIDSRIYEVSVLDHTNLTLSGYRGDLIAHQRFQFSFLFELDGEQLEVPTHGVVLKTGEGTLTARYMAPQPYYQKIMRRALGAKVA